MEGDFSLPLFCLCVSNELLTALAQDIKDKMSSLRLCRENFCVMNDGLLADAGQAKPIHLTAINSSSIGESCAVLCKALKNVLAMLQSIRYFKKEAGIDRCSIQR